MAPVGWLLFADRDEFRFVRVQGGSAEIVRIERSATSSPESTEAALAGRLRDAGYGGEPVVLALDSSRCVNGTLEVPLARQARKRTALGYLLEPHLPWSVEDAVVDFELVGNRAFLVAIEAAPARQLIQSLENQGLLVVSISPMARLALARHLTTDDKCEKPHLLLWGNGETIDCWLIDGGHPIRWYWLPHAEERVRLAVGQLRLSHPELDSLVARNLSDEFVKSIAEPNQLKAHLLSAGETDDPVMAAAVAAQDVIRGRCPAAIELRRDALGATDRHRAIRRPLRFLQGAALFFAVAVGIALFLQSRKLEAVQSQTVSHQQSLFRRLFAKLPIPVAIESRLQSELTRLKGVRGDTGTLPANTPYLSVLQRFLSAMPKGMRSRILEMRIENGRLYLVGQVRSHGDADRIAESLRSAGLDVEAPNTHALTKEGVEFRISARSPVATRETIASRIPRSGARR